MKDPGEKMECSMTLEKQKAMFCYFPNLQKATMGPEHQPS